MRQFFGLMCVFGMGCGGECLWGRKHRRVQTLKYVSRLLNLLNPSFLLCRAKRS